ncbi:hypothetical protein BGZ54_004537 [Gamsiella multidivaricata]|nr:hypothetical protein BGZ54_004537 [Gamsiella multidivaricata]
MLDNEAKRSESENYGLEFPVTFTGKEAVDVVVELTKLDDRRHSLSIARSLESQLLFFGGGNNKLFDSNNDQYFFSDATLAFLPGKSEFPTVPTGVFPYSAKCYSYGCIPGDATCYSYLCPNRQHIGNVLGRQNSGASSVGSQEKVWANSVPASVVASASKKERNRQEAIFEVVNTEGNYVRDLELMEEIFINPLRAGDIVDSEKVDEFIEDVFLNYKEIMGLNKNLLEALKVRQEEQPLVERIGDVLLAHVVGFEEAYARYIPRIALSEYAYKKEETKNPKFAQFLKDCTRHPEARRLGLRHFVGQPYQRIPRYPLLLSEVVKRTDEGVEDRETVQEVIKVCTELGKRIDACMPEGARQLRLLTIQDKIFWKSKEEHQDLKLGERSRKLHYECMGRRKATFDVQATELRVFLFDHMLLMTKEKRDKQGEKDSVLYQVSRNAIPLELADVWPDDGKPSSLSARELPNGRPKSAFATVSSTVEADSKQIAPVTIQHRGRRGGEYLLYMTLRDRDEFVQQVAMAKKTRQDVVSGHQLFEFNTITEMSAQAPISPVALAASHPMDGKRVTCSAPYLNVLDGKRRIVIGTEYGVYVGIEDDKSSFRLALKDINVSSISVLEGYHLLLVLSGKVLKAFNMSCLEPDSDKGFHVGQQLGKNVQYFTAGVCAGKTLVITMRRKSAGESHFTAFEPLDNATMSTQQHRGFGLSLGKSKPEWFKLYREFYVPSDSSQLQMLSKMVCVVCPRGFEVLMLENLGETRVYPTKADSEYAFLLKRTESVPVCMFKINTETFLMCYSDFAFTMTKNGNLAKTELIEFEGRAESFAMVYPYIIAFESELIEIRHIDTGALEQLVLGNNIRMLYSDVDLKGNAVIHVHMSDPGKGDSRRVVKLDNAPQIPRTLIEPIKYQPKSSYTSQTSALFPTLMPSPARVQVAVSPPRVTLPLVVYPSSVSAIPQRPSPRFTQQQPIYAAYPPDPPYSPIRNSVYRQGFDSAPFWPLAPIPAPVPVAMPMPMAIPMSMPMAMPMSMPAQHIQPSGLSYEPFSPQSPHPRHSIQNSTSSNPYSPAPFPPYSQIYPPAPRDSSSLQSPGYTPVSSFAGGFP